MAWRASITVIILIIFVLAVRGRQLPAPPAQGVVLGTTTVAVLTPEPKQLSPSYFSESGTLVFYPNNVGPVPYLYYTDAGGALRSVALVLSEPLNHVGVWSGGRVGVTGIRVHEHVEVVTLTYLAPP